MFQSPSKSQLILQNKECSPVLRKKLKKYGGNKENVPVIPFPQFLRSLKRDRKSVEIILANNETRFYFIGSETNAFIGKNHQDKNQWAPRKVRVKSEQYDLEDCTKNLFGADSMEHPFGDDYDSIIYRVIDPTWAPLSNKEKLALSEGDLYPVTKKLF